MYILPTKSRHIRTATAAMLLAGVAVVPASAQSVSWKTVANSSTVIPLSGGKTFSSFGQPSINNLCRITFRGRSTGPSQPTRGVYSADDCTSKTPKIRKVLAAGDTVPAPNNLDAPFNEFPAFPRIDLRTNLIATRGQSQPVWSYILPDTTETRIGTAGIYVQKDTAAPLTGVNQLGVLPEFSHMAVPGFPGVKFDQFPGSPSAFDKKFAAFKGNFTDGSTSRTGVYFRNVLDGPKPVVKIADTTTVIPGTSITFGSTAPPSAADGAIAFSGSDNEDNPTAGGLYLARRDSPTALQVLARIGGPVPDITPAVTFNRFGEGLSYDGSFLGFWGAWGSETRTVRLHCPTDGNDSIVEACETQCPDTDADGHYCERTVPLNQGIFVRDSKGRTRLVARAGDAQLFKDFLFWTFSGRPPGTGGGDENDFEPPRWRSSAFVSVSPNDGKPAVAFKGLTNIDKVGIFLRKDPKSSIAPLVLVGDDARLVDPAAPAGATVSAIGLEREGFRNCNLAINASFLNTTTSESWAGVYLGRKACK